jgi:hypothetical protein
MADTSLRAQVDAAIQEAAGNCQVKTFSFPFQSFFDSTQLGQALATQPTNAPIVPSTLQRITAPGFGLGLHPDSQAPIAVTFKSNVGVSDSPTIILTPGQIVYPHGCAPFSGFDVGLPFGWLGGGNVQLVIMKTPQAAVWWAPGAEVIIHRQRAQIQADGAGPTFAGGLPLGFPWKNAKRYNTGTPSAPFDQSGQATISVVPTRVELKLRLNNLAADALVQLLVKNAQAFDQNADGTLTGETEMVPLLFPKVNGAFAYFPTIGYSFPVPGNQLAGTGQGGHSPGVLLAGDDATFALMNESGAGGVTNAFVDIVRYGLI